MNHYGRAFSPLFSQKMRLPFVHILFGARQTGKSTLIRDLLPADAIVFDLSDPSQRARFAARPGQLVELYNSLPSASAFRYVLIDEAQMVPELFDAVQYLFDDEKRRLDEERRTRFILCGSSARRLRQTGNNLLPGRSIQHHLYPLTSVEYAPVDIPGYPTETLLERGSAIPALWTAPKGTIVSNPFPRRSLEDRLIFGDLPAIATESALEAAFGSLRSDLLRTYASAYIEEELHRETRIREWGPFLRFLAFSASESGKIVNFAGIAKETGVSAPTIKAHYQLLEDMFLGFTVPAFSGSTRKAVLSSPRFFFFDCGVRNAAAGLSFSVDTLKADPGPLFEQWVGIELYKRLSFLGEGHLSYFRTSGGAEVDFIIERGGTLYPIEVKWTENPTRQDARHVETFLVDHASRAPHGYIICRCPYPQRISDRITAIPWWAL
jgi:predicted AAA+ superfamily ATPase